MPKMEKANYTVLYNFALSDGRYTRERNEPYLLYYGRLSHEKGIKTLIEACKENLSVQLKIVGTGPLDKELREEYGNNKIIEFLGYHSGASLKQLVRNAQFVVVPSEWYENNPMTIVEAYSMGTPVIGAQIGGIPEIVVEGETGFRFESGNSKDLKKTISKAIALETREYEAMRKAAYRFYQENFSPEKHYEKLMAFYKHTLEQYER